MDAPDLHHEQCREQALQIHGPVVTSWAVIAEAAWLLRSLADGLARLLAAIDDRDIEIMHIPNDGLARLQQVSRQYEDLRPQIADLTLVYLAEQLYTDVIFTLDRRDFSVYRTAAGKPFQLLP